MKLKRTRLFSLLNGFEKVKSLEGVRFSYGIVKNKKKIQVEIDSLKEAFKAPDKLQEYEKKRIELCEKYSEKDENNKSVVKDGNYTGLDNNIEFNQQIEDLKKEYKTEFDNRVKQIEDYNKLLLEEVEIDLHQISLKDIPENITAEQMDDIEEIVKDEV